MREMSLLKPKEIQNEGKYFYGAASTPRMFEKVSSYSSIMNAKFGSLCFSLGVGASTNALFYIVFSLHLDTLRA